MKGYIFALCALVIAVPAAAWTGPTQAAPGGNVAAPINTSGAEQTKPGMLNLLRLDIERNPRAGLRLFDRTIEGTSWDLFSNADAGSSAFHIYSNQVARDVVKVKDNGAYVTGNVWAGGLVGGTLQVTGGTPAAGHVLTSLDANGTAGWAAPAQGAQMLLVDSGFVNCAGIDCNSAQINFEQDFSTAPHIILTPRSISYSNGCRDDAFRYVFKVLEVDKDKFTAQAVGWDGGCGGAGAAVHEFEWLAIGY